MKIFFFNSRIPTAYQNDIIPVGEGFRELGCPFAARHTYWQEEPGGDFLFKESPDVVPEECDLVVGSFMLFMPTKEDQSAEREAFLAVVKRRSARTKVVFIDDTDGYSGPSWRPEFRGCDLILRTKYNARAYAPKNVRPWAIGLTRRTLLMASAVPEPPARRLAVYVNYGASHAYEHSTRRKAKTLLHPRQGSMFEVYEPPFVDVSSPPEDPYDRLMWEQTGGRHSRTYFERMKSCLLSSAFCGEEIPAAPWNPYWLRGGGRKARFGRGFFQLLQQLDPRPLRVVSGDSFRFWESLACGTAPLQVDFGHYGLAMPVQPDPFEHYLPVRFDRIGDSLSRIRSAVPRFGQIGDRGRDWAAQHYAPKAVAKRLLDNL